ncbi:hypothetical protein RYX36_010579 [Vicia faba]
MRGRNLQPALTWVSANSERLARIDSNFEFKMHTLQVAADPDTDEVYAKLRLFPLHPSDVNFDGDNVAGVNDNLMQSYTKTLTQSDANNGGFACPKNCTEITLPQSPYAADLAWSDSLWKILQVTWDDPDLVTNTKRLNPP